jgi:hypothetical protein
MRTKYDILKERTEALEREARAEPAPSWMVFT